jgi:ATP-dependent helicase/nuclease subunit B
MPLIYTLPPGLPFLGTLAEAILAGDLPRQGGTKPTPISLAQVTLLLPTRRATRALQEAFLTASKGAALLLPKIKPIGEGSEDLTLLSGAAGLTELGPDSADIPPAISELQRRLVLTQLVMQWSRAMRDDGSVIAAGANTPAQAAKLAAELARLMDMVETEGASLAGLDQLVPEDYAEHWNKTLAFLKIIVEMWPAYLAANETLSPMERRNRVLRAEAQRLRDNPPKGPIIVAGVTGSIPAAAELMAVVAALPNSAIVLPGLDQALDDESFALALEKHPEHPQYGLAKLLRDLGVERGDIAMLGASRLSPAKRGRQRLVSEALRPAETTDRWFALTQNNTSDIDVDAALANVHLLEAPTAQDEAEAVALILRHAVETPGRTAALVSPDRLLARRVIVRLSAWGITVDDSAGRPFAKTVPGAFLDLIVEAAATDFAPAATMALLKHPLTRLGLSARDVRRAARYLELAAFRGIYLGRGLDGMEAALEIAAQETAGDSDLPLRRPRAVQRLWTDNWQAASDLIARLRAAFAPWLTLVEAGGAVSLQTLAAAHAKVGEALAVEPVEADATAGKAGDDTAAPRNPLWDTEAGEAAQKLFTGLMDEGLVAPALTTSDYPEFYRGLISGESVRPRQPVHPRIAILGPFESRLQQPDVVILGSLNDGTWPEAADPGPWLNRPMRKDLKLPSPEEKIGYAAHDFSMLLGADRVYMTRALKIDGVPTVPSRWLMRIQALLAGLGATEALKTDEPWLAWARARDTFVQVPRLKAPAPCPPVALRPRALAVTQIERWLANPYVIYASHILKLEKLPDLGAAPDQRLRGVIIHDALGRFAKRYPASGALPADVAGAVLKEAEAVLATYAASPRVAAFWRPRFARFATWFAETEPGRRKGVLEILAEIDGRTVIAAPGGPFSLRARADRIDVGPEGLRVIDYKTGTPPSKTLVESGRSPQLSLEALILQANGFAGVTDAMVATLTYIRATGGEPPGLEIDLNLADVQAVIANAHAGLVQLVADFDDPKTPYQALRRASLKAAYMFDDFAHLARVDEWSSGDGPGGE